MSKLQTFSAIIFVTSHPYLSDPLFKALAPKLAGCLCKLLDVAEFASFRAENVARDKALTGVFSSVVKLSTTRLEAIEQSPGLFRIITSGWRFSREVGRTLTAMKPAMIVLTTDLTLMSRICHQWARRNQVPIILIQPSFFTSRPVHRNWKSKLLYEVVNKLLGVPYFRKQPNWGMENQSAHLLVWGERTQQMFQGREGPLQITGNPLHDELAASIENHRKQMEVNWASEKPLLITFFTANVEQFMEDREQEIYHHLLREICMPSDQYQIQLKIHPREKVAKYKAILGEAGSVVTYITGNSIEEVYQQTDVHLSVMSSTAVNALILGVPVLFMNPCGNTYFRDAISFLSPNTYLGANSVEQFHERLTEIRTPGFLSDFWKQSDHALEASVHKVDGNANQRVLTAIGQVLKRG